MAPNTGASGEGPDRFQLLVDALEEFAIFTLDPSGIVVSWNSGAKRIKGFQANEIIGQHFSTFYTAEDIEAGKPERGLAISNSDGSYRDEGWRVRKDGSTFWANVVISAIRDGGGQLVGFAKVTRDESDRRAVLEAAQRASCEALRANAAKNVFLSRMSHELRTPLNAILGFGQLLEMDDLGAEQRDSVHHIITAGDHLLELIDEVLDIAQMESGELRLSLEPVDATDVMNEAIAMLRPLADQRGIRIVVTAPGQRVYVQADRRRFRQALVNLLANAVKYNRSEGRVTIVSECLPAGRLRMTFTDTGLGIAEGDLTKLFQPFERLSAERSTIEGTGLGLALTRNLMTAMNGEVGAASRLGEGSSFWIELATTVTPPGDRRKKVRPPVDESKQASTEQRTILYVEDNLSNIMLFERLMTHRPYVTLMVAQRGRRALELAIEHRPDLILVDLHLPDISGEQVVLRLRGDPLTATTPIIVLSADAIADKSRQLLSLGATAFMPKPFDIPLLLGMIDDLSTCGQSEPSGVRWPRRTDRDGAAGAPAPTTASGEPGRPGRAAIAEFVHDINNLLGVILTYESLLSDAATDWTSTADLGEIHRATERAMEMAKSLLNDSSWATGMSPPPPA